MEDEKQPDSRDRRIAELEAEVDRLTAPRTISGPESDVLAECGRDILAAVRLVLRERAEVARLRWEIGAVREPVRWFAKQMERKLKAHDDRDGWEECSPGWLLDRLRMEIGELAAAMSVVKAGRGPGQPVIDEAADVANFAMMIADNTEADCKAWLKDADSLGSHGMDDAARLKAEVERLRGEVPLEGLTSAQVRAALAEKD